MKAVILAGGLGTRLKPFTEVIPKPLLPLGSNALLEVQVNHLKKCGFTDVYLAINYKGEFIRAFMGTGEKYGLRIHYSEEDKPLGTCGPLSLIRDKLTEPFIVMNGDILTQLHLGQFLRDAVESECALTVGTKIITTPFRFGNVQVNERNHITFIEEKPTLKFEIVAGIYGMTPAVFERIPYDTFFGVDSLIQGMLADKEPVYRYQIRDYWIDIGQVEDYSQARKAYDDFQNEGT